MARIGNLIRDPADLHRMAKDIDTLSSIDPTRVTKADLKKAAQALLDAGNDIAYLLRGELVGCPCRRIDHDNGSYLVYDKNCPHHRQLQTQIEAQEERYAKAEKKLKDELRVHLVQASLTGLASVSADVDDIARRAIVMADAVIAKLVT